jgi:hypothetical protein
MLKEKAYLEALINAFVLHAVPITSRALAGFQDDVKRAEAWRQRIRELSVAPRGHRDATRGRGAGFGTDRASSQC